MTRKFDSRLRMYNATYNVLTANQSTFASYPALVAAHTDLNVRIEKLLTLKQDQEKNRKGYALGKKAKRNALATMALKVRGKVSAYAKSIGDDVLFNEMNITDSKILHGKSSTALTLSVSISDAATSMPTAAKTEFDITAAMMTAFEATISDYKTMMDAPRIAVVERKTQTAAITTAVKNISLFLRDEMDGLMRVYDGTTFFDDYVNARRIVEEVTLQARVIGLITAENGSPVEGAKVEMTDGKHKFEDMTDENGRYRLRNLNPELYMFKVTKPGFAEYIIPDIDIYAGEHEKLNVEIKSAGS